MRKFLYLLIIFLFGFGIYSESEYSQWEFKYLKLNTQVYKSEEFRNRIDFKYWEFRFLYIDVMKNEDGYRTIGFSFPWLTAGPLQLQGLFKEIYNPSGYTALSSAFRERTEIKLSSSFTDPGTKGISIEIVPDLLGFYQYESDEEIKYGGFLSYINDLSLEFLFSFSNPEPDSIPDSWFIDNPLFPGGLLLHTACRLSYSLPEFFIYISACRSGGENVQPGYYSNTAFVFRNAIFELGGLAGVSSDYYFNPSGKLNKYRNSYNAEIKLFVLRPFVLSGEYWLKIDHPGFRIGEFLESKEGYSVNGRLNIIFSKNAGFVLNTEYKDQYNYNANGDMENKKSFDSGISINIFSSKPGVFYNLSFLDHELEENKLKIDYKYRINSLRLNAEYSHSFTEHQFTGWKAGIKGKIENGTLELSAGMDYFDFYITLGFEYALK